MFFCWWLKHNSWFLYHSFEEMHLFLGSKEKVHNWFAWKLLIIWKSGIWLHKQSQYTEKYTGINVDFFFSPVLNFRQSSIHFAHKWRKFFNPTLARAYVYIINITNTLPILKQLRKCCWLQKNIAKFNLKNCSLIKFSKKKSSEKLI